MKKIMLFLTLITFSFQSYAVGTTPNVNLDKSAKNVKASEFSRTVSQMTPDELLALTPKKYQEKTGKKMGLKNALKLKMAKRFVKKAKKMQKRADAGTSTSDIPKGLFIVMAIFGLAWIAMGLFDNWKGSTWIIGLVLALLLWLPGLIYALIKMGDYY